MIANRFTRFLVLLIPGISRCSERGCRNVGLKMKFDGTPPEPGLVKPMDSRGPVCWECWDD